MSLFENSPAQVAFSALRQVRHEKQWAMPTPAAGVASLLVHMTAWRHDRRALTVCLNSLVSETWLGIPHAACLHSA
jgi:hypothetical protein